MPLSVFRRTRRSTYSRLVSASANPAARTAPALGLLAGVAADQIFGDPHRGHPVAAFGTFAARLEARLYRPRREAGALHLGICLAAVGVPALVSARLTTPSPVLAVLLRTVAVWTVLGGRSLGDAGLVVGEAVATGDIRGARAALPSLCGREPSVPRRRRAGAGGGRVGRREHLRRRRRPAGLGRGRRRARAAALPRGQHARRDGRPPQRALRRFRHARRPASTTSPTGCRPG